MGICEHKQKLIRRYKHQSVNPWVTSETAAWGMWGLKNPPFVVLQWVIRGVFSKMNRPLLEDGNAQWVHTFGSPWWKPGRHLERLWKMPWLCCGVISPTAAWGTALCVVEVFKTIFINMIKYLLHESAIRASLKQWTQRRLLICLWNPSGITDGPGEGGWMQLSVTEAVPLPGACLHQHTLHSSPHTQRKGLLFFFLHIPGQRTKAGHDFDSETLNIPCRDVTQAPFSGGRI